MQPVVGIDADQMGVERGVMDFRERKTVWNYRLAEFLFLVRDDVGGIKQQRFTQSRQRTAAVVSSDDGFAERRLMQSVFDCAQGITPLERSVRRRYERLIGYTKYQSGLQRFVIPPTNKARHYSLIAARGDA